MNFNNTPKDWDDLKNVINKYKVILDYFQTELKWLIILKYIIVLK